jgi:hypothetical protein
VLTRIAEVYYCMEDWEMAGKYFGRVCEVGKSARAVWGLWNSAGRGGKEALRVVAGEMLREMYDGSGVVLELEE